MFAAKGYVAGKLEEKKIQLTQQSLQIQQQADQHNLNMQRQTNQMQVDMVQQNKANAEAYNNKSIIIGMGLVAMSYMFLTKDDGLSDNHFYKICAFITLLASIGFLYKGSTPAVTPQMIFSERTSLTIDGQRTNNASLLEQMTNAPNNS